MKNFLPLLLTAFALLIVGCGDESDSERYNARATVTVTSTVNAPIAGYKYIVKPSNTSNAELAALAKTTENRLTQASGLSSLYSADEGDKGDKGDGKEEEADPEPKDITRNFKLEANSAKATITLTYVNSTLDNGTSATTDKFGTWTGLIAVSTSLYSRPGVKEAMVNVLADYLINYPKDSVNKDIGIKY